MGLETVELVIGWEREFSISIPASLAETLITPEDAARAVEMLLADEGRPLHRETIEKIIRTVTLEVSGIDESDYLPNLRFVQDFGMD